MFRGYLAELSQLASKSADLNNLGFCKFSCFVVFSGK